MSQRARTRKSATGAHTYDYPIRPMRFDPAPLVQAAERTWGVASAFTEALRNCTAACVGAGSLRFHVPLEELPGLLHAVALELTVDDERVMVFFGAHPETHGDFLVTMTEVVPAHALPCPIVPLTDMNALQALVDKLPAEEQPADPSATHLRVVHVKEE